MRYTLAVIKNGHWHYYVERTKWSVKLNEAMLLKTREEADSHRTLLPDREDLDCVAIVPIRLVPEL